MATKQEGRTMRADATRNREAILDAALDCLVENPQASMAEIAAKAGVGRVTLYGHFSSRGELVGALFERTMERAETQLAELDLTGEPEAALDRLVRSSWRIVGAFHQLLGAAEQELSPDQIREHHTQPMQRVTRLIARGKATGVFRTDMPKAWLTACFYSILHTAASEVRAGRLDENEAPSVVPATIRAVLGASRPTKQVGRR